MTFTCEHGDLCIGHASNTRRTKSDRTCIKNALESKASITNTSHIAKIRLILLRLTHLLYATIFRATVMLKALSTMFMHLSFGKHGHSKRKKRAKANVRVRATSSFFFLKNTQHLNTAVTTQLMRALIKKQDPRECSLQMTVEPNAMLHFLRQITTKSFSLLF